MDLRQLRYFTVIAEEGGFSAAANVLRIAQSALSRQIRLLEEECGGLLFERGVRGLSLTDAGSLLLTRSQLLLQQAEAARTDVRAANHEPSGTIRLGTTPSVAATLFQPLAVRFLGLFPRVRLQLVETIKPDPVELLTRGDLDLAIAALRGSNKLVEFRPLFREPMCLFGLPGDPLLRDDTCEVELLLDIPLVVPVGAGWLPGLRPLLGDRIARLQPRLEVVSMICMKQMVAAGLGYGVVPLWTVQDDVIAGSFSATALNEFYLVRGLVLPRDRPISRISAALADVIQQQTTEMITNRAIEAVIEKP